MTKVPELDMFNGSYFDAYKGLYSLVAHEVTELRSMFSEGAVNNINGYKVGILTKLMFASSSFMTVIETNHDYSSAATILRSIADNLSSYILIYHNPQKNEIQLRHNLFLYDGFQTRKKSIQSIIPKDDSVISMIEKQQIQQGVEFATNDTENAIKYCLKEIRSDDLYKQYKEEIEYLIRLKRDNWKYVSLEKYKEKPLSWGDMYPLINGKEASKFFISYLSQFVHGLSSSNLSIDNTKPETFFPMIHIGITFLGKIHEFAQEDFGISKEILQKNFFKTDYGREHLSYVSPSYIKHILKMLNKKH